jgi:HSP20 family protein
MANLTRRPFWDLRRGIDELFDDFLSSGAGPSQGISQSLGDFRPSLELEENESEYKVTVELPGLKPEEVELTVDQGMLTVRGEKRREERKTQAGVEYTERSYGSFVRTVQLPRSVAADKIAANYENGVLSITLPKGEESRPRRISVGGGTSEPAKVTGQTQKQEQPAEKRSVQH